MASNSHQSEIEIVNAFDGLAPPFSSTSATSSSPLQKLPCNVFINHRGPDVKHTLARDIYDALHAMGLNVFLDSEDLHLGDFFPTQLQQAMSRASLHVAIFSPTYAQSPWCLAELSFMLKTGTPVIPIFYRVQPADLRHLKGIYETSFSEYEEKGRYIDKLEEWKKALHNVSFYEGEIVNNNEEERRVLKNIVNRALKVINIVPLEVAKYAVGLEELVADFEMTISEFAKIHSHVQVVGIWGMGGSGKTTLAKELYNKKYSFMKNSSFLFDIRNAASKSKLHKMQRQLLQDLEFKGNDQPFSNIEQGKNILSNYLRSVPVFIVLDDVDHPEQLEALLPAKASLASRSLIIVTTRDKEVLRVCGISCIYEMKSMNRFHARQLFCWHAFLQPTPSLGYEDLVEKFISASSGLPLSLKVFGALLYDCFSKDLWEEVLNKICRLLPSDIINRLRISYDALDKEEKQMFMDAACFLIGKDKMTAIAVWEGSGWSGQWGWKSLVNKCLVDLDNENKIRMHDHLRDLGREIARTVSPYRLWSPDQFTDIDKQEEIRGMKLSAATNDVHKFTGSLWNTSMFLCGFKITRRPFPYELKVFVVGENYGNYLQIAKLSRELAWLSCTGIAHRKFPSWMPLKNLRVLEFYDCYNIVSLWNDGVEAPVQLRVLIISSCSKLQRLPKSIGYLKNLKKITLSSSNVKRLPEEFGHLQSLEHLQLRYCERLSSLPSCFGQLTDLRHLDLSGCLVLKMLPDSCKHFTLLQHLDLQGCKELTLQSDILENMSKLEYLNLNYCTQLEELPRHITNQASLSELYLNYTRLRELPINIGQLSKLRVMEIGPDRGCFQMQSLPDSMGTLTLLEKLFLQNLEVQSLPKFSSFNFKEIHLESTRVSKISILDDCCPGLKILRLWVNNHLTEVDTVPTAMEDIWVGNCKFLRNISGIGGAVNLQYLRLIGCPELDTLPSFDKLALLKELRLEGVNKVETIQGLQHCTSLEELWIEGKHWEVSGIKSWEHLQRLRSVKFLAKMKSAVERCIQTIQKWPDDVMICTKAGTGAGSLLNSSTFPNLSIVHSVVNEEFSQNKKISFNLFNHSSDGNAMIICMVINCASPSMRLCISDNDRVLIFRGVVEEGKWALIGVFTQLSRCLTARTIHIKGFVLGEERNGEVEEGMVVRGEEESVVEGFHRLLALLLS